MKSETWIDKTEKPKKAKKEAPVKKETEVPENKAEKPKKKKKKIVVKEVDPPV
jgi:hypothetical protein